MPPIQDLRKPPVEICIGNPQNRDHDALMGRWLGFVDQEANAAPLKIHSMSWLNGGDLQDISVSST